jgi:hypothetical protein
MAKDNLSSIASVNHSGELTFRKLYKNSLSYRLLKPTTCIAIAPAGHLYILELILSKPIVTTFLRRKIFSYQLVCHENRVKYPKSMYIMTTRTTITILTQEITPYWLITVIAAVVACVEAMQRLMWK